MAKNVKLNLLYIYIYIYSLFFVCKLRINEFFLDSKGKKYPTENDERKKTKIRFILFSPNTICYRLALFLVHKILPELEAG